MRHTILAFAIAVVASAPSLHAATQAPEALHVVVSPENLSMTGVAPGGQVVVFGMTAHNVRGMLSKKGVAQILTDSDSNGVVTYAPADGIAPRSVWVAVSLATGALAVAAPDDWPLDQREIKLTSLKRDADGLVDALEIDQLRAETLLVRPGDGAWLLGGGQGGSDADNGLRNGKLTLFFDRFQALLENGAKAPKQLKTGDVIAIINPSRFEIRTLTIAPQGNQ